MPSLDEWRRLWRELGVVNADEALYGELIDCYSESHRHYHTLQHLAECLAWLPAIETLAEHPAEIALALWFHDAIYRVRSHDNERMSAQWASESLSRAGLPRAVADRVHALVMATQHDAAPSSVDARLLVDVDLAILGAEESRFLEYEAQVRKEYAWVPMPLYRGKRKVILEAFLSRPSIYNTFPLFDRHEARARHNLRNSIDRLARG